VVFSYNSLCAQAVAYTAYFELGKPVIHPAMKGTSTSRNKYYCSITEIIDFTFKKNPEIKVGMRPQ